MSLMRKGATRLATAVRPSSALVPPWPCRAALARVSHDVHQQGEGARGITSLQLVGATGRSGPRPHPRRAPSGNNLIEVRHRSESLNKPSKL